MVIIRHLEKFAKWAESIALDQEDFCLVAGTALAAASIRPNNDFDIVITPNLASKLNLQSRYAHLFNGGKIENINGFLDINFGWAEGIGYSDDELISDNWCHLRTIKGWKYVRPEIVMSWKNVQRRKHDQRDVELIGNWQRGCSYWDWSLFRDPPPAKDESEEYLQSKQSISVIAKIGVICLNSVRRPTKVINRAKTKLKNYCKTKLTLNDPDINTEVMCACPVAYILANEYRNGRFNRYDLFVRYLAMQGILNNTGESLHLYTRMQKVRKVDFHGVDRFRDLIKSAEKYGLDPDSRVEIFTNGKLSDGAHRIVLALHYGKDFVSVRVTSPPKEVCYDRAWFESNGFTIQELSLLDQTKDMLFLRHGLYFQFVLWPPLQPFFEEVTEKISREYSIRQCNDLNFSGNRDAFTQFVKEIYAIDDIAQWKVDRKLWALNNYQPSVRILAVEIPQPQFRFKSANPDHTLSRVVERIKDEYRSLYKTRIDHYFYDILLHIGDNFTHNRVILKVLDKYQKYSETPSQKLQNNV